MKDDEDDSRIVHIWKNFADWINYEGWVRINFDDLEPGMIVRFDCNDNCIYTIISYPFMSQNYSPYKDKPVETIICNSNLYYYENG